MHLGATSGKYAKPGRGCSLSYFQAIGKKDEDRVLLHPHPVLGGRYDCMYCVFDGHNGDEAADYCTSEIVETLEGQCQHLVEGTELSTRAEEEILTATFVRLDEKIRADHHAGTTATVLLQRQMPSGETQVLCVNVGDSWCAAKVGDRPVEMLTSDHSTRNGTELSRTFESLRQASLEAVGSLDTDETDRNGDGYGRSSSEGSVRGGMSPGLMVEVHNEHGTVVSTHEYGAATSTHTFVGKLVNPRTGQKSQHRIFAGTLSVQVTRSIGDYGCAHTVVPEPEFERLSIPPGERARVVVASDGCWDVFDGARVHRLGNQLSCSAAAKRIAVNAKERRIHTGHHVDDITVLVVDINADAPKTPTPANGPQKGSSRQANSTRATKPSGLCGCFAPAAT